MPIPLEQFPARRLPTREWFPIKTPPENPSALCSTFFSSPLKAERRTHTRLVVFLGPPGIAHFFSYGPSPLALTPYTLPLRHFPLFLSHGVTSVPANPDSCAGSSGQLLYLIRALHLSSHMPTVVLLHGWPSDRLLLDLPSLPARQSFYCLISAVSYPHCLTVRPRTSFLVSSFSLSQRHLSFASVAPFVPRLAPLTRRKILFPLPTLFLNREAHFSRNSCSVWSPLSSRNSFPGCLSLPGRSRHSKGMDLYGVLLNFCASSPAVKWTLSPFFLPGFSPPPSGS